MTDATANHPRSPYGNPPHLRAWCIARWVALVIAAFGLSITSAFVFAINSGIGEQVDYGVWSKKTLTHFRTTGIDTLRFDFYLDMPDWFGSDIEPNKLTPPSWSQFDALKSREISYMVEQASGWPVRCMQGANVRYFDREQRRSFHETEGAILCVTPDILLPLDLPKQPILIPLNILWGGMLVNTCFYAAILAVPMLMARSWCKVLWRRRRRKNRCQRCKHQRLPESKQSICMECGFCAAIQRRGRGRRWVMLMSAMTTLLVATLVTLNAAARSEAIVSPVSTAIVNGDLRVLQEMIADGLDVNATVPQIPDNEFLSHWNPRIVEQKSLLMLAVAARRPEVFELLIQNGASPTDDLDLAQLLTHAAADTDPWTWNLHEEKLDLTRQLLDLGADPLFELPANTRPLFEAMPFTSFECFSALVHGSDCLCTLPQVDLDKLVLELSFSTEDERIQRFLEGAFVGNLVPLICVNDKHRAEVFSKTITETGLRLLLLPRDNWETRLCRLIEHGYAQDIPPAILPEVFERLSESVECMEWAVEHGFDPFAVTEDGSSWWFYIIGSSHGSGGSIWKSPPPTESQIGEQWWYLYSLGVDPSQPRNDGTTALEVATTHLRYFLQRRINEQQNPGG